MSVITKGMIRLGNTDFQSLAVAVIVANYGEEISEDEIYTVWLTKVLQNNKALLSTTRNNGLYFEVTYNGDKQELYVDRYVKESNSCLTVDNI